MFASRDVSEEVCMMTGMPPTGANTRAVQAEWAGGSAPPSAAASPTAGAHPTAGSASAMDEINCLLTGMSPNSFNVRACESARMGENASFSSVGSCGSNVDEINCMLTGMAPTEANQSLSAQHRNTTRTDLQGEQYNLSSITQGMPTVPRPIRKISVRRVATMLGPM